MLKLCTQCVQHTVNMWCTYNTVENKLAKLADAIVIFKSEISTLGQTGVGARRCYRILKLVRNCSWVFAPRCSKWGGKRKEKRRAVLLVMHGPHTHITLVFGIWHGNYGMGPTHYSTVGLSKLLRWSIVSASRQLFQILQNLCQNSDEPKLHNYTKCMRQQQTVAQCSNNNYFRFRTAMAE